MSDEEPKPVKHVEQKADSPDENINISFLSKIIRSLNISSAGLFVFVISAIVLLAYAFLISLLFEKQFLAHLRAMELMLSIAGVSLIVILTNRESGDLLKIFGFLLIGALIVPTNDLMRFAALVSGSEDSLKFFFTNQTAETNDQASNRNEIIARRIVEDLVQGSYLSFSTDQKKRKDVVGIIANTITADQQSHLYTQIRQQGALQLLRSFYKNEQVQSEYLYGDRSEYQAHLRILLIEGLVEVPYGDIHSSEITRLGTELLERYDVAQSDILAITEQGTLNITQNVLDRTSDSSDNLFEISGGSRSFNFTISEAAYYIIEVDGSGLDPYASVFQGSDLPIAENDDYGDSLNSRIVTKLDVSEFTLKVDLLGQPSSGSVYIRISKFDSEPIITGLRSGDKSMLTEAVDFLYIPEIQFAWNDVMEGGDCPLFSDEPFGEVWNKYDLESLILYFGERIVSDYNGYTLCSTKEEDEIIDSLNNGELGPIIDGRPYFPPVVWKNQVLPKFVPYLSETYYSNLGSLFEQDELMDWIYFNRDALQFDNETGTYRRIEQ